MFFTSRITVTVGSILVPAFLSIQGNPIRDSVYLAAWIISILVSVCNGFVTLFKIDRKYFFIHMTLELLHSEAWQYLGLSGRYKQGDSEPASHENQFLVFFHMAEKIKLRQVEEEYWKFNDTSAIGNTATVRPMDGLQTPITQQGVLASLPVEQKNVIEGWLGAMVSKKAVNTRGLMPRLPNSTPLAIKPRSTVDEESQERLTPLRRSSSTAYVPVQFELHETPTSKAAVVPETYLRDRQTNTESQRAASPRAM